MSGTPDSNTNTVGKDHVASQAPSTQDTIGSDLYGLRMSAVKQKTIGMHTKSMVSLLSHVANVTLIAYQTRGTITVALKITAGKNTASINGVDVLGHRRYTIIFYNTYRNGNVPEIKATQEKVSATQSCGTRQKG